MEQLLIVLYFWLSTYTTLTDPGVMPTVQTKPEAVLIDAAIRGGLLQEVERPTAHVAGICTHEGIYIADTVDITTTWGRSIVLHEVSHYWQTGCKGHKLADVYMDMYEQEARVFQNLYIKQHGGYMFAPIQSPAPLARLKPMPPPRTQCNGGYC